MNSPPLVRARGTPRRPESGFSNPATSRSTVVLPLPEGPRSATISLFATDRERSAVTCSPPKCLSRRSRTRKDL